MGNLWYISPSSQYGNVGIGSYGTEAEQMNLLTDRIVEHLDRHGVDFHRAEKRMSIQEKCAEADAMGATWYVALHSNAGGGGKACGPVAFYESESETLAVRMVNGLLATGQKNNRASNLRDGARLYEVRTPKARSLLLEVDFHDSAEGVSFLVNCREDAAQAIARAIVEEEGKHWSPPEQKEDGASLWAKEFTEEAKRIGLFQGDGDGYRWQDTVTREELAVALIRLKQNMMEQGVTK